MDMEHDWKAARTEAARADLVAQSDTERRCAALEAACRYEVEQHGKARDLLVHIEQCRRAEVGDRDQAIAYRDQLLNEKSSEIGALRHQLAAALKTICLLYTSDAADE